MGRPSKLTPERKKKLIDAIKAGNYYDAACGFAGVDYSTFRRWMIQGEEAKKGVYYEFYKDIKKAEHEAETRMVTQWQRQMPEDWKAIATFLERRYPDKWGKREQIKAKMEHSGEVSRREEYYIEQRIQNDEEYRELLKQLYYREQAITGEE